MKICLTEDATKTLDENMSKYSQFLGVPFGSRPLAKMHFYIREVSIFSWKLITSFWAKWRNLLSSVPVPPIEKQVVHKFVVDVWFIEGRLTGNGVKLNMLVELACKESNQFFS